MPLLEKDYYCSTSSSLLMLSIISMLSERKLINMADYHKLHDIYYPFLQLESEVSFFYFTNIMMFKCFSHLTNQMLTSFKQIQDLISGTRYYLDEQIQQLLCGNLHLKTYICMLYIYIYI